MKQIQQEADIILESRSLYIYGAGDVARQVAWCLYNKPFCKKIDAFVVTEAGTDIGKEVYGRPVVILREFRADKDVLVLVAVLEKYRDEICRDLLARGYRNYLCVTFESNLWAELRRRWFAEYIKDKEFARIKYLSIPEKAGDAIVARYADQICVYVAMNIKDKAVREKIVDKIWERRIQAGAVLTSKKIADIADNIGDNISEKNPKYCELTALYWAWKNTKTEYVGLSHYRRRFDLNNAEVNYILDSDVDIVVTVPILNVPDIRYMYEKNHIITDWERMRSVVKEFWPEYEGDLFKVEKGNFYFGYNMLIMKRRCLNEYCDWLFGILEKCETDNTEKNEYQKRYLGFLAERMLTVFILHNLSKYRVIYADKCFYE